MSVELSRRGSTVIRQILKEIISDQSTIPSTQRRGNDLEKIKLNEAVCFLERKIQRQHSEIKVISEQLSREIQIKQEVLMALNSEREKNSKLSSLLANSNKSNAELRKKLVKFEGADDTEKCSKEDYQIKLNKYREIVRKKDELILKHQQKIDEFIKNQRSFNQIQQELKSLRDNFVKLKHREEHLTIEVQGLRKRYEQSQDKIKTLEEKNKQKEQMYMFSEEHLRRLQVQFDELSSQHQAEHNQAKQIQLQMKQLLDRQNQQIKRITQIQQRPIFEEQPQWQLTIFKNQVKRICNGHVKDVQLRRKLQKQILGVVGEMQGSFNKILVEMANTFS